MRFFLFSFIVVVLASSLALGADDQYKPYLHKANIPEHPKVKLYGQYQTSLFPGATTYSYGIDVPKGTNGLQPSLSISYNSQSMKQRPPILGAGWSLTQNYIYRNANFTPSTTNDDSFVLILNGAPYNLLYIPTDGFYRTEMESFSKIENLSTSSNAYGQYWLVTLKDGTQLRFGESQDSELTSNSYPYALKWSISQIQDTHSNSVFYAYREDPYPEDKGSVYISSITYNNEQRRKVEFAYESAARKDRRRAYEQGSLLEESRRLTDISVLFNSSMVRRYHFDYSYLNAENSLSSLANITHIGNDNASVLHKIMFSYYDSISAYANSTTHNASEAFQDGLGRDLGIRLADLNNDGFIDMMQSREAGSTLTWINNRTGWRQVSQYLSPFTFVDNSLRDMGTRLEDVNSDGFVDIIKGRQSEERQVWLNTNGSAFARSDMFAPPRDFIDVSFVDMGVQFADLNGDGWADIVQAKEVTGRTAFLNNHSNWSQAPSYWNLPLDLVTFPGNDLGVRIVDVNGDGLSDLLLGYWGNRSAYLNNGSGWVNASQWAPPDDFITASRVDNGLRLADLNGDGLVDLLQDYANGTSSDTDAWINNGSGWTQNNAWKPIESFTKDGKNVGRRIGDVNGDGFGDIIVTYNSSLRYTLLRNSTLPYLLKNITNELGGITIVDYSTSTSFNNTGDDGLSDLGFNVWVVRNATQDNGLKNTDFSVTSVTSYSYEGGLYSHNDTEFRGFAIVNETFSADNSTITHYFHQTKALKGKEHKTEIRDRNNNLFSRTENNYNTTKNAFDGFIVQLLSSESYAYDGQSTPEITNTSFQYDNFSNLISKTQFGDVSITGDEKYENYSYPTNLSSWIIDKPSWYILFDQNFNKIRETKYFYDSHDYGSPPSKGDLTKVEQWLDTGGGNPTTYYTYDDFGNLYAQTDALGRTTTRSYGGRDFTSTYPDRITNPLGHPVDYEYDVGTGNIIRYTKHGVNYDYTYDTFGRITKDIDPYDSSDFPTKLYTYSFDGIAPEIIKVSQKTSSTTLDAYYIYDGFGNLVQIKSSAEDGNQVIKNIFYDGLGRVKEEQNPFFDASSTALNNATNLSNKTTYIYDAVGRVTSVINPDGTFINTTYNLSQIDDYDANRNRHTYLLDAYGRIIEVREYNTDFYIRDSQIYNTTYSYNGADELIGIRDTYDNTFNFSFDSLGRKTKLKDPDLGTWTYSYDLAGNLISQIGGGGNLISGDNLFREYNGFGQLVAVKEGNTSGGRTIESYSYDPNGDRIRIDRYSYTGGTNETIYTPYREWMQIKNSSGTYNFHYVYEGDVLVARLNPDGTKWFYHSDHLGSTSLITDEAGNIVEDEFYSPFGESLSVNDDEEFKLYTGQFKDTTGQYYYGARYYIPSRGQLGNPDPLLQNVYVPQTLNHYSYAANNPFRYTDRSGQEITFGVIEANGEQAVGVYASGEYQGRIVAEHKFTESYTHEFNGQQVTVEREFYDYDVQSGSLHRGYDGTSGIGQYDCRECPTRKLSDIYDEDQQNPFRSERYAMAGAVGQDALSFVSTGAKLGVISMSKSNFVTLNALDSGFDAQSLVQAWQNQDSRQLWGLVPGGSTYLEITRVQFEKGDKVEIYTKAKVGSGELRWFTNPKTGNPTYRVVKKNGR